jgi:hypothetical protein
VGLVAIMELAPRLLVKVFLIEKYQITKLINDTVDALGL